MHRLRNLLLLTTALMPLWAAPAAAGPNGATVVGGSANVQNPGSANVTVNQFSDKAIINWNLFNIGVGEKTTFNQPNSSSIALNRVVGGLGPSEILGTLTANGKVFIVNRDGIIFGAGAVVTTAGFLATTSDIKNSDFMAGRFNFQVPGRPDASIVNLGTITATSGGFAALVAPGVRNSGTITATLGSVGLASANTFSLDFYGDKLITLGVGDQIAGDVKDVATGKTLKSLVTNEGALKANGGRVELTAAAARQVVDSVINTSGVIEANSVGTKGGQIVLSAATAAPPSGGRAQGGGASASGGTKQTVRVSGTLSASGKEKGTKGGSIIVTGQNIEVAGATIDASGRDGGGKVLIGGDWAGGKPDKSLVTNQSAQLESFAVPTATTVSVDAATKIDASAKDRGDGGKVILWADGHLSFTGTILALGGKELGRGGFVETSGHSVDVSGTINAGSGGLWLLDPADLLINTGLAATIQSSLNSGMDVTQQTAVTGVGNGDIIIDSGVRIVWNTSATLTLIAFRNIQINDGGLGSPPGNLVNTGAGNLVMRADSTGTGTGTLVMNPFTNPLRINWSGSTGKVALYYNPTIFGTQDVFTSGGRISLNGAIPDQLTQYMLVNNATNLQNMGVNLGANYALHKDIDVTSIANFAPIGGAGSPYTGRFDGLGHTISNLTIAPTTPSGTSVSIGMFGTIGATGHVSNLNITNASVTANPNVTGPGQFIGILAGSNGGTVSNVTVDGTVSHGTANNGVVAGGLIGQNGIFGPSPSMGAIVNSLADVTVSVGNASSGSSGNSAGGLVGGNPGSITTSFATGDVSGGAYSFIGGFVGRNDTGSTITDSGATGNVTNSDATGSAGGGFVGFNFGTISGLNIAAGDVTGATAPVMFLSSGQFGGFVGLNDAAGVISGGVAGGNVSGGGHNSVGGFVGFNNGMISGSAAAGNVTGGTNFTGGFVGGNFGSISSSIAIGAVSGSGFGTGGFAGMNGVDPLGLGTITNSSAFGTVQSTGTDGEAGGFIGQNQRYAVISGSFAFGNVTANSAAGGFAATNDGTISNSFASGTVTVGDNAIAGGFVGGNFGQITGSTALATVTGGSNTVLGGFAAGNLDGTISNSSAFGPVTSTGANSIVGGFAGISSGPLTGVTSSGPVTGTSESYLGGLVGINIAKITDSFSSSTVTGTGAHNIAGGIVGMNFGFIDPTQSSGNVSSGPDSIVGIFVGANGALRFPDGSEFIGTVASDSAGTGTASGGAGSTVGGQVGQSYPVAGLPDLPQTPCSGSGSHLCSGVLFNPNGSSSHDHFHDLPQLSPLLNIAATLVNDIFADKKQDEVITPPGNAPGSSGGSPGGQKGGANAGRPSIATVPPPGFGPLPSGMPPLNETRFLSNEVVMQLGRRMSPEELAATARQLGLEIIQQQTIALLGRTIIRFRITGGMSVRAVIAALEAKGAEVSGQPSYVFKVGQHLAQAGGAPADTSRKGDSAQYVVGKLRLADAHVIATGNNVRVAVIDSEIDSQHPDLQGVITGSYDALPSDDQTPHPHGTGMAGAIASHQRLLGVAPGAKLLAVRAFGASSDGAQGTSMNIVKGLQWAVDQGARVINMSFAGPRDPILQQAIKLLTDRGIILIAAAGNAGPKSPPLFPGADPNVIAVSATDVDDKTYKNANRGRYVAIAAPGVDILVPAPDGGYQLTTGTSVAAAHISGVAALLLERNPQLKPSEVRGILTSTAKNIGSNRNEVGAGLVDPVPALAKAAPKSAEAR